MLFKHLLPHCPGLNNRKRIVHRNQTNFLYKMHIINLMHREADKSICIYHQREIIVQALENKVRLKPSFGKK